LKIKIEQNFYLTIEILIISKLKFDKLKEIAHQILENSRLLESIENKISNEISLKITKNEKEQDWQAELLSDYVYNQDLEQLWRNASDTAHLVDAEEKTEIEYDEEFRNKYFSNNKRNFIESVFGYLTGQAAFIIDDLVIRTTWATSANLVGSYQTTLA
jgi:hypothetical protein